MIRYFEGLEFFILLVVILLGAIVLRLMQRRMDYYLLAVSVGLAGLVLSHTPDQLIYLVLYLQVEYIIFKLALRYQQNKRIVGWLLVLAVLPLVLVKVFAIFKLHWLSFVGISYISFKNLQILFEVYDGLITNMSWRDYLNFLLFFPAMSSGPIDRSGRFLGDLHQVLERSVYLELLGTGLWRLVLGMVYKIVIANTIYVRMTNLTPHNLVVYSIIYLYAYTFYLFFDFAGYSLMAVGVSNILGIQTPMNFKLPFLSVDIKDFWMRWHITLSTWLRDFVFTRFVMFSMKRKWFKNRLYTAMMAYILNMVVMGVWHGVTLSYILYGVYHGLLLAGFEYYQKKSQFYKKYKKHKGYRLASWFVTIHLVMIGFFIFSGKWEQLMQLKWK